jgi:hypothetical protein
MSSAKISFALTSPDPAFLEELREAALRSGSAQGQSDVTFGEVGEVPPPSRLDFDVFATVQVAYQVVTVLGALGGAARFIEWLVEKIKLAKDLNQSQTILVSHGGGQSVVSTANTADENRTVLSGLLVNEGSG